MEPFDPVPLPSRPSPFYKLKSIAFTKEAGSSALTAAGSNILRPAQKQTSVDEDADGELSLAALQAKKERLLADRERLTAQLARYKEKYELEHKMRLDSEKMADDCVRRSKITENDLISHRQDIKDLQYHVRCVRSLALSERADANRYVGSRGTVSETLPSGAAASASQDTRSGTKQSHDAPLSPGVPQGMKHAKSPATTVAQSESQKAAEEAPPSPLPSGRKSQRADVPDTGKTLTTVQSLENLLHEVSNCANAVDAMDDEKVFTHPDWEDEADIEMFREIPVVKLKHPSGNEAVVHLRTGLFWRWATSDGRVLVGGLPQIWPDVIPYEGQVWSLEADALKDDQDEPSVTLTYVCDARQCRVQMTLSACARGLRQRITVENLGTHNLVFNIAPRASEANAVDPPADMFPPGETLLDARCLDPMPSSPALIAPMGSWAAMRRWTDRELPQVGR